MKNIFLFFGILFITQVNAQQPLEQNKSKDLDYYMMKNDHLLHYLSTGEVETVMSNATLSNGIVIMANGDISDKKSSKQKLRNGECVNAEGMLQPCVQLDSTLSAFIRSKAK